MYMNKPPRVAQAHSPYDADADDADADDADADDADGDDDDDDEIPSQFE